MANSTKQTLKNAGGMAFGAAAIFGKILGRETALAM
jgi:hypothetical protein